jgi:epoxyqueuosine reductase QueG
VWSERHTAFAAGHGSFGLSDGFITAKGIAHRCGSIITDLQLVPSGRTTDDHHANCVFYADGTCKACAVRCPAGAITDAGHDKRVCGNYCRAIGYVPVAVYDDETTVYGCGLCQTKVPCEYRVPLKIERMRR